MTPISNLTLSDLSIAIVLRGVRLNNEDSGSATLSAAPETLQK
jgi:hypothetical protein